MNLQNQVKKITSKIEKITADRTQVMADYTIRDDSVQAELRLSAKWEILLPVDRIHSPRDLSKNNLDLWRKMYDLDRDLTQSRTLKIGESNVVIEINARTKTGAGKRTDTKNAWIIEAGNAFLSDYRAVTSKRHLAVVRKSITDLQTVQKSLLPKLRESNVAYLAGKKTAREEQTAKNIAALKSGRFWEADRDALKNYFHPPFDKNYLADISEKWRSALFLECKSMSYERFNGEWGHKLAGTGRGYLCGIDDNGDEWGHHCNISMVEDNFGDPKLDGTVEEGMSDLFGINKNKLRTCQRQGDLLFCPTKIMTEDSPEHCQRCGAARDRHTGDRQQCPDDLLGYNYGTYRPHIDRAPILTPEEKWTPRVSHDITSPTLKHNGTYFRADDNIVISHTSHKVLTLPAGEYRLYALAKVDAD